MDVDMLDLVAEDDHDDTRASGSFLQVMGDGPGGLPQGLVLIRGHGEHLRVRLLGDDERMPFDPRVDIEKREVAIVLPNLVTRDFAINDALEQSRHVSSSTVSTRQSTICAASMLDTNELVRLRRSDQENHGRSRKLGRKICDWIDGAWSIEYIPKW
jgi:hypothetical protein